MGKVNIWSVLSIADLAEEIEAGSLTGQILVASLKFARFPRERKAGVSSLNPSTGGLNGHTVESALSIGGIPLSDLKYDHCRWPIGDPHDPGFVFCGEQKGDKSRYCDKHHKIAYRPVEPIDIDQ